MISVIVPIYNEAKALSKNTPFFEKLTHQAELIFVDGGSTDEGVQIAGRYGKILHSKKSRAIQMNRGAGAAQSDVLFFLHADSTISINTLNSIEEKINNYGFIGGCLRQRIEKTGIAYRFIENFGNIRAGITKVFYGDQGIFVRKDTFLKINGFPEVPIMEDVLFTKRLRRLGNTSVLSDKIFVSSRRWEKKGIARTVFLYSLINILFYLKFPLGKIKHLYDDLR